MILISNNFFYSYVHINLKDFINPMIYGRQWRYRIEKMRVYLYDEFDHVIPNPNGEFSIKITYPPTFNDTNSQREVSLFSARHFFCRYVLIDENESSDTQRILSVIGPLIKMKDKVRMISLSNVKFTVILMIMTFNQPLMEFTSLLCKTLHIK